MKIRKGYLILGIVLFIVSLVQAFVYDWAHYYTFFSLGMVFVLLEVYRGIKGKSVFEGWRGWQYVLFWVMLIIACVFIDAFGMDAGYWVYPDYVSLFDDFLKYVFEWGVALIYFMVGLMIGIEVCKKYFGMDKVVSFFVSLLVVVSALGLLTEYVNLFVDSWLILSMPLWNFKVGEFFVVFQTFGYWAIGVVPYLIWDLVRRFGK
ncbi:hypothetical protein HN903_03240 [archaeon]|jgi:hypothetical protein|nr:hypothetical protein [archaeon]MBT7128745.1 hypothetical protein [archaeon]